MKTDDQSGAAARGGRTRSSSLNTRCWPVATQHAHSPPSTPPSLAAECADSGSAYHCTMKARTPRAWHDSRSPCRYKCATGCCCDSCTRCTRPRAGRCAGETRTRLHRCRYTQKQPVRSTTSQGHAGIRTQLRRHSASPFECRTRG
jgi:hypothetical protein